LTQPALTTEDSPLGATSDYYETYWSAAGYNPRGSTPTSLRRIFEQYVCPTDRCLDVGCGDGGTSGIWLNAHSASYVGVDISRNAIRLARESGLDAREIDGADRLPFDSSDFDVVVCIEVFEHLFAPQAAAEEILRVLRIGGLFIATVPNIAFWRRRVDLAFGRWNAGGDDLGAEKPWRSPHVRFFTARKLHAMLRDAGFVGVVVRGTTDAPFLAHVPLANRLSHGEASDLHRSLAERFPGIASPSLLALATKGSDRGGRLSTPGRGH
jgi:SAM-dependent methyltransferase